MAIVFVSAGTPDTNFDEATVTVSINPASGQSIGVLIGHATSTKPTSVVFNSSENLSAVDGTSSGLSGRFSSMYFLKNPTATTANIVVTFAASQASVFALPFIYSGVDQTTPHDGAANASGFGTAPSITITSATGDLGIVGMICAGDAGTYTPTNGTNRATGTTGWGGLYRLIDIAGAASVTINGSLNTNDVWTMAGGNFNAAGGGSAQHAMIQHLRNMGAL